MTGLALAVSALPSPLPLRATTALASGTVRIDKNAANGDVTYNVFRVFSGKTDTAAKNKMYDLAWPDDATRSAVVGAIRSFDSSYSDPADSAESAQRAAEEISNRIKEETGTPPSMNAALVLKDGEFGKVLADALSRLTPATTATPGTTATLDDGYYLFLTKPGTVTGSSTGTSPIFAVVGQNNNVTVSEKTTVPTLVNDIRRENGSWGRATDRYQGETVELRLKSSLPTNLLSFKTYYHGVDDVLPVGLTPAAASTMVVRAYANDAAAEADVAGAGGTDVTSQTGVHCSVNGQNVSMRIDDVHQITLSGGSHPTPETVFVTYYKATVNQGLTHGSDAGHANRNQPSMTYSANPSADRSLQNTGTRTTDGVKVYNYVLTVHKQDKSNASRALRGAEFTIQVSSDDGTSANNGKYLQANGSVGASAYNFVTDANGDFSVEGIDAGTYVLREVKTPAATNGATYDPVPDVTLRVTTNPETDAMQVATDSQPGSFSFAITAEGSSDVVVADSVDASGSKVGSGVDAQGGSVSLVVRDTKRSLMPLTGQGGTFAIIAAAVVAAAIAVRLLLPGRRDGDDEQGE